ncbi:MAG TPA: hypothetical protein ENH29_08855 [Bacteroidetes bacterium]|nr:hypothetical protein [Bacteroidota bacterium]
MRPMHRFFLLIVFTLSTLSGTNCSAVVRSGTEDAGLQNTIKKSFKVAPGGTLTLNTDIGTIEIKAIGDNRVKVEVFRKVNTWSNRDKDEILDNFEISFDQHGDDVGIRGEFKNRSWWDKIRRKLKIKYVISVPKEYNVDLNTSGGSISIDDLRGKVRSKTSGGSLTFGAIEGPVYGRTSGGSISLEGCVGTADVRTSGGSIHIGNVDGNVDAHTSGGPITIERAKGEVVAKTSGGSIKVEEVMGAIEASTSGGTVTAHISRQPQARCYLKTSGGSVKVYLAEGIAVNLDAKTSGGHVETDFPVTVQGRISKSSLRAKINGGGPELVLRTSGGSIYLRKL